MLPKYQKQNKQTSATTEDSVVPKLMTTITALRARIATLKAELEQMKLASTRAEAQKVIYRNGVQQQ